MAAGATRGLTRRDWLRTAAAAAVGAAVGTGAHGYSFERLHLGVTRAQLPVSGLPPALAGLRLGLLTDTHLSTLVPHELIERAVALLLDERPDLIVLGGDYVTWGNRRFVTPAAEVLRPLTAPQGVFAILGNHDDDHDMPRALSRAGFEVLEDARTTVRIRGEPVDLLGLRFWTRTMVDLARLLRGARPTTFLLAHDPRRLHQASALGVPLVLSGHTHGGQVVLPYVGALAGRKFPVLAGVARREHTTVFVSRGVGTVYVPCRINCPPEVAVLTLERKADF
ncbi:MAG: metallophosphoesterase [Vicinamibacteraceae bacterium]